MKSMVVKRSVSINGHKTSVSLEEGFWDGVKEIARLNGKTTPEWIGDIERSRTTSNLSSALRLSVLEHFRQNGPKLSHENAPDGQGHPHSGNPGIAGPRMFKLQWIVLLTRTASEV